LAAHTGTSTLHGSTRRTARIGLIAAAGIALFVLESLIPTPLPFLKIGLANVSTVVALEMFGFSAGVLVMAIRVSVGSLLVGALLSPSFLVAAAAGLASSLIMGGVRAATGRLFSVVGLSLIGAIAHVIAQLCVVSFLFVRSAALLSLLPLLLTTALIGGIVVGWVASAVLAGLRRVEGGLDA